MNVDDDAAIVTVILTHSERAIISRVIVPIDEPGYNTRDILVIWHRLLEYGLSYCRCCHWLVAISYSVASFNPYSYCNKKPSTSCKHFRYVWACPVYWHQL